MEKATHVANPVRVNAVQLVSFGGGYWTWDDGDKTVRMHLRTGEVMDIGATEHSRNFTNTH